MKNIILYGFMGTGKTTVGRMLATKSGSAFIDTDAEIVKRQGMSIPDIFATRGEEYFRQCEAELMQELAGKRGTIISTGGGTMRNPANVAALHGSGIVVYLVADVDTILARTQKQGERPVLDRASRQTGSRRAGIEQLIAERRAMYESVNPDLTVDTSNMTPLEIVTKILSYAKSHR